MKLEGLLFVTVSEARKRLAELVGVEERVVVTRNGSPVRVLLSVDDYNALIASLEVAKEPARLARAIEESEVFATELAESG